MDHRETVFQGSIKGLQCRLLFFRGAGLQNRFRVLNVDITEMTIQVLVVNGCRVAELTLRERLVDLTGCDCELMENPAFCERLFRRRTRALRLRLERLRKFPKDVFRCLIYLIAKATISMHDIYLKCDVITYKALAENRQKKAREQWPTPCSV